jgi:hypothetical protein
MRSTLRLLSLVAELAGVVAGLASHLIIAFSSFRFILPLPEELLWLGSFFALLAIASGVTLAWFLSKRWGTQGRASGCLKAAAISIALMATFFVAFWIVEYSWKIAPPVLSEVVYNVVEPAVYGAVFGCIASAVTFFVRVWRP